MGKYKLYQLTFKDHVRDHDEALICHVVGWLIKENDDSYVISSWIVDGDKETFNNNLEKFCILKSTVVNCFEITLN